MIFLIAVAAWIFALSLVAGLCAAARKGDSTRLAPEVAPIARGRSMWEPGERAEIGVRPGVRAGRPAEAGVPAAQRDGVAA
jgi:hypothetical protein